eukprot:scaffold7787_cov113-Cylindrotheca_fusiformis.AAC.1
MRLSPQDRFHLALQSNDNNIHDSDGWNKSTLFWKDMKTTIYESTKIQRSRARCIILPNNNKSLWKRLVHLGGLHTTVHPNKLLLKCSVLPEQQQQQQQGVVEKDLSRKRDPQTRRRTTKKNVIFHPRPRIMDSWEHDAETIHSTRPRA